VKLRHIAARAAFGLLACCWLASRVPPRQLTGLAKPGPSGWLEAFQDEDHQAERLLVRPNDAVDQVWEAQVIRRLLSAVEDGDTVLVGNSTPIRDFDSFSGTASKAVRLVANRGTNGIDGGVAFLLGLAEASSGRNRHHRRPRFLARCRLLADGG
jgi:2-succinyl-5-enolpyruvyl-6-hydroxy-3-cyclohexene-1-carboxylate synthase